MLENLLQPWFIFAFLSAISLGISEILQQKILNHKTERFSVVESGFFTFLIQFIFSLPVLFICSSQINIFSYAPNYILLLIISTGAIGALATLCYLKSFEVKNISFSGIFASFSMITSAGIGFLLLGESMNIFKFFGFATIILAIILVSLKTLSIEKNNYYGLISGILWGVVYTIDSVILDIVHPFIFLFWHYFFILITLLLFNFQAIFQKIKTTKINQYQTIFFSAVGYILFNTLMFYSFHFGGEAGKVDGVSSFNIFLIIIFEYFILKQKTDFWLKIISFLLALIGIILLGMF